MKLKKGMIIPILFLLSALTIQACATNNTEAVTPAESVTPAEAATSAEVVVEAPAVTPTPVPPTPTPLPPTPTPVPQSGPFTATTGLSDFSAYQISFTADFDGTRAGEATTGKLSGELAATKNPQAQHWRVDLHGQTFESVLPIPGLDTIELIDAGNTFYIKNPADGTWLGIPAMFIDSMLPAEMGSPESVIELPKSATRQPGQETVNGILTERYTFDLDDFAGDTANLRSAAGTVWVAVDGDYVVKYEAEIEGQFEDLSAGGVSLLDDGVIRTEYTLAATGDEVVVQAPANAASINLGALLFQ